MLWMLPGIWVAADGVLPKATDPQLQRVLQKLKLET